MKVIFLDFDGVLNSEQFHQRTQPKSPGAAQIDPDAVNRLNRLVGSTGAHIVISSSWRHIWNIDQIKHMLRQRGFKHGMAIIDRTPMGEGHRGQEIQEWLDLDPERKVVNPDHEPVDSFVILDDDSDMLPEQQPNFVKTDGSVGLTDENVDEAIAILRMGR